MDDNISAASTPADSTAERNLDNPSNSSSYEWRETGRLNGGDTPETSPPQIDVEKGTLSPTVVTGDDPYLVRLVPTDAEHPYVRPSAELTLHVAEKMLMRILHTDSRGRMWCTPPAFRALASCFDS
jgi:hypothetical protein